MTRFAAILQIAARRRGLRPGDPALVGIIPIILTTVTLLIVGVAGAAEWFRNCQPHYGVVAPLLRRDIAARTPAKRYSGVARAAWQNPLNMLRTGARRARNRVRRR